MYRLFVCLLALVYFPLTVTAEACSPPANWSEKKAVEAAHEIFTALVTKVELSPVVLPYGDTSGRYIVQVYYERQHVIKGHPTETGPVTTTKFYMGGCGVPFAVGIDYLLFVEPFAEEWPASLKDKSSGLVSIFNSQGILPGSDEEKELISRLKGLVGETN